MTSFHGCTYFFNSVSSSKDDHKRKRQCWRDLSYANTRFTMESIHDASRSRQKTKKSPEPDNRAKTINARLLQEATWATFQGMCISYARFGDMLMYPELGADTGESGPSKNCRPVYFHCRERNLATGDVRTLLRPRNVFKSTIRLRLLKINIIYKLIGDRTPTYFRATPGENRNARKTCISVRCSC